MNVTVLAEAEKRGHEQVCFFHYPEFGLKAIVGIHDTTLGPALGGCRMRLYEDESHAIDDAMRLSEGMTYKSSLAGLDLGGGKSCLIADRNITGEAREKLFLKFAECLNHLGGRYITAEDMGTSVEDVVIMRKTTSYAAGYPQEEGGAGDPSPWTAYGVFRAMLAAAEIKWGSQDLNGKRVSVQGTGHVGIFLLKHLKEAGCELIVCDKDEASAMRAKDEFGAKVVGVEAIYDVDCDIYAPCAIGQTVNPDTIKNLKCEIICGGANNQLTDSSIYSEIDSKGILYCPDFVINAGGVISAGAERNPGGWKKDWVNGKVERIFDTTKRVIEESRKRGKFPEVVAVELARERIEKAKAAKAAK